MPLILLRSLHGSVGSRVHSVLHEYLHTQSRKLLCPPSLLNVTCDTRIHVQPSTSRRNCSAQPARCWPVRVAGLKRSLP